MITVEVRVNDKLVVKHKIHNLGERIKEGCCKYLVDGKYVVYHMRRKNEQGS